METETIKKQRVCVGMSGGVDSSVTAALLLEQGFEVISVYMKNWDDESPTLGEHRLEKDEYRMACPWYDDYLDAKRVALQLGIPFYLWDFRESYKKKVFDHFVEEFAKGRTPNPDVYCNSQVKFDDFLKRAVEELKADYVATGHYARLETGNEERGTSYCLQIPKDTHKDQTYFLYRLNQEQLSRVLFPLADYTKQEVRELAKKFNLPTQQKKDSQGICFIGQVDVRDFISQWLAPKEGEIHDANGQCIGKHRGVHLYTIGEKIAVDNALVAVRYPEMKRDIPHFYIAKKDVRTNILVVVPGSEHPALYAKEVFLESLVGRIDTSERLFARIRHGGTLVMVDKVQVNGSRLHLRFKVAQRALAPGQHLVLYNAEHRVVGGGIIAEAV